MKYVFKIATAAAGIFIGASISSADTLQTHRIPAALAAEAASETVAACAKQGYHETAVVLDADGTTIAALRDRHLTHRTRFIRSPRQRACVSTPAVLEGRQRRVINLIYPHLVT